LGDLTPADFACDPEIRRRLVSFSDPASTIEEARRLHQDGKDEHALFLLECVMELAPTDSQAVALARDCRESLERACRSALGPDSTVLVSALSLEELKGASLDSVGGFLVSLMDGKTDIATIIDISCLPRLLVLRHLRSLMNRGVVSTGR
jgi:hypothetical protein